MKAIILAAGQGTRLKKYTENLPKGMLNFMGKTIIEHQIQTYRKLNIHDIIIVKGFAAETINYDGIKYYENIDFASTNMIESLLQAKEEFDDDIVVSYSDILFSSEMLQGMVNASGDFVVAVDDNWKEYWLARYGKVDFDTESLEIDENDNIISLGLEAPSIDSIDARYVGLLKFSKNGLENITNLLKRDYPLFLDKPWMLSGKKIKQAYMTDLLMALIKEGYLIKAKHFNNGWIEFDTNEDYEKMCEMVSNNTITKFFTPLSS